MIKRRRNQHPFPSEEAILESVRLYEEGWTLKEIGKKNEQGCERNPPLDT